VDDLSRERAESDYGVQPAECERIRQRSMNPLCARIIGNVIEIAFGVALIVIRGGREYSVVQRENCGDGFQSARSAEGVAVHGFCRADG
jgi:hypothetical protein